MHWFNGFLAVCLVSSAPLAARADAIDDYVNVEMARQHIPGLALAVMRHGKIVRMQGYGYANLEHQVPVHADTLFKTGAVGMQLTAVAAMLLVEDGKIALDAPITHYLSGAPSSWKGITIRQLLHHTSGLPATPNGNFRTDYSDDELLGIIYKQDINFPAGTRWRFSYTDYIVLGLIIKKVSGEYYGDLLTRRVFRPLGMNTAQPIDELAVVPNRAAGYERRGGTLHNAEWVSPTANSTADGSLYLSALDYAAWDAGLVAGKILKPESWAEIARPASMTSGHTYPYGFGWYQETVATQAVQLHGGVWQGFKSYIIRYLGDELTVVALANSDNADPAMIARHVAALVEPKLTQTPGAPIADSMPQRTVQAGKMLEAIAAGKAVYADFAYLSRLDFNEMQAEYQWVLGSLGTAREVKLFARAALGDDDTYIYRARYEKDVVEMRLSYAPNGKVGGLEIALIDAWDAPLGR